MKLSINGKEMEFEDDLSVADVLAKLNIESSVMAVALNMNIVKQDEWRSIKPQDGDSLEFLDFVGGG
ncbi:MAG: sulfur carrier protein ThiS [Sulfuricurvum sp.]